MITAELAQAAKPAQCTTGNLLQKWQCGWNQPHTAHAATTAGHDARPFALLLAVALVLLFVVRRWPGAVRCHRQRS